MTVAENLTCNPPDSRLVELIDQLSFLVGSQKTASISFGELWNLYLEKHVLLRNKNPSNAHYFYQRHGSTYADVPVNSITQRQLQAWCEEIGRERGATAAKRALDMFSAVIAFGIRRGYVSLHANPAVGVERFAPKARSRFASPQELTRLAAALKVEAPVYRNLVWMLLFTGQRKSNVLAMRWQDIDFDLCHWRIADSKNGDEIVVALTNKAIELLKSIKAEARPSCPWVFPGEKGERIKDIKRMWARVCRRADISGLRIHDLRRTCASYLAMQGSSAYLIGRALGHRDPRSTAIYARLDLQSVRAELEKVQKGWLQDCLSEESSKQASRPELEKQVPQEPNSDKTATSIGANKQIIVEAKIILAMHQGATTKKEFYKRFGRGCQVNSIELDRILAEMEARGILVRYKNSAALRHYQNWRYKLAGR